MLRFAFLSCGTLALAMLAGLPDGLQLILAYGVAGTDLLFRPSLRR